MDDLAAQAALVIVLAGLQLEGAPGPGPLLGLGWPFRTALRLARRSQLGPVQSDPEVRHALEDEVGEVQLALDPAKGLCWRRAAVRPQLGPRVRMVVVRHAGLYLL